MKKFRFNLEPVERVRKMKERDALRRLSESQRGFVAAVAAKEEIKKTREEALIRREELGKVAIGIHAFVTETHFITGLKQRMIQADQAIVRAQRQVEKSLRSYLHARRDLQAIEKLREKAYENFKMELRKAEAREMDDQQIMRSGYKRGAA